MSKQYNTNYISDQNKFFLFQFQINKTHHALEICRHHYVQDNIII